MIIHIELPNTAAERILNFICKETIIRFRLHPTTNVHACTLSSRPGSDVFLLLLCHLHPTRHPTQTQRSVPTDKSLYTMSGWRAVPDIKVACVKVRSWLVLCWCVCTYCSWELQLLWRSGHFIKGSHKDSAVQMHNVKHIIFQKLGLKYIEWLESLYFGTPGAKSIWMATGAELGLHGSAVKFCRCTSSWKEYLCSPGEKKLKHSFSWTWPPS